MSQSLQLKLDLARIRSRGVTDLYAAAKDIDLAKVWAQFGAKAARRYLTKRRKARRERTRACMARLRAERRGASMDGFKARVRAPRGTFPRLKERVTESWKLELRRKIRRRLRTRKQLQLHLSRKESP